MVSPGAPARVRQAVRELNPGYFALVMASGIISVGMLQHGRTALSALLLVVCAVAFVALVALDGWRVVAHRDAVRADITDPRRAFGFYTFVAGGNVLGVRLAAGGRYAVALVLLAVTALAWLVLGYLIPWTAVVARSRRPVLAEADGSWFLWVVGGQSVAVAAAGLERVLPELRHALATVAVLCWSVGVVLYAAVGVLVSARLLIYPLRPAELTASYWVAMGATAISVLAGARIVGMRPSPMVQATRGLVGGVSVLLWAFGTWLIPVLVAAGWWRHRVHRVPLVYDASLWGMVFPLGMYAVAATSLSAADHLPLVGAVGAAGIWVAFAVWLLAFAAMLGHLYRTLVRPAGVRGSRRWSGRAGP